MTPTAELNALSPASVAHVARVGLRGRGLACAGTILYARQRAAEQARVLLRRVEQVMAERTAGHALRASTGSARA
ncbi:MAG: hypothetical protein AB1505_21725 [Candidatus Latescibacterota bacterium]